MIRAVLDTNTVISGLLWSGAPSRAIDAALDDKFLIITSQALIDELNHVLMRPKLQKRLAQIGKTANAFLENYQKLVEIVQPIDVGEVVRDPKDNMVIACAVGGKADYIVSGDNDLLTLKEFESIAICNIHQFLSRIE